MEADQAAGDKLRKLIMKGKRGDGSHRLLTESKNYTDTTPSKSQESKPSPINLKNIPDQSKRDQQLLKQIASPSFGGTGASRLNSKANASGVAGGKGKKVKAG